MARLAKTVPVGEDRTQHLSLGVLALCFPMSQVQAIIAECGKASQRVRDLPAPVVVFYVIALSLFPGAGYQNVLQWLLTGLQWWESGRFRMSGKGALSAARQRLGPEPMRLLHERLARPLADPNLPGSHWKGMLVVALDGTTLALQDTASNAAAFGRASNQHGAAAYPLARAVALVETGTHLIFAAELGRYQDSELSLAGRLLTHLEPGMLCLADRLFPTFDLWQAAAATGCQLLWRAKASLGLIHLATLADGSWLARWPPPKQRRGDPLSGPLVRVVEYRLAEPAAQTPEGMDTVPSPRPEVYRLLTTLLNPDLVTAEELAAFYPQRWEMEITIKESKNVLRQGQITLRSKVAELVQQEFWGLLLAHYLVRKTMAGAALRKGLDPDELSFQSSAEIIKAAQTGPVLSFPP